MRKLTLALALLFSLPFAQAWDLGDFKQEAASPVTYRPARWALYVGGSLTLAAAIFEDQLDHSQSEVVEDKPLGDLSHYGDLAGQMVPNAAYVLGQSIAAWAGDDRGKSRAIGMFKATAYAATATTVLKYSVREPRPNERKDRNSFPSGHSTTAFAFAGYVLMEHGWGWGVPALGLATLTAASRINDNKHRTHDVLAGATIGMAYAMGIAGLQGTGKLVASRYQVVPMLDDDIRGLVVTLSY